MMKHSITKILNFGAGFYDKWAEHNLNKVYQKFINLANLNGNEKVLNIGCGSGNFDLMIAKILPEDSIFGIDTAPKMIEIAKRKANKQGYKIDYRIGSSTKLPYENNEFDIIFTCLLYHYLIYEEKSETLKEIQRVLKQNSKYFSFELCGFPNNQFHLIFLKLFTGNSGIMQGLYPAEIIEKSGFYIDEEIKGPSFAKHHQTNYRIMIKK